MRKLVLAVLLLTTTFSTHAALRGGSERAVAAPALAQSYQARVLATATDGTDFLTLWQDTLGRQGIFATITNEAGVTRARAPEPLLRGTGDARAVWTGDAYLVVLVSNGALKTLRLDRNGEPIAPAMDLGGATEIFDLAWNDDRALAILGTHAILFDATGRFAVPNISLPAENVRSASVTAAGDAFLVTLAAQTAGGITAIVTRVMPNGKAGAPVVLFGPEPNVSLNKGAVDSASRGNDVAIVVQTLTGQLLSNRRYRIDAATLLVTTLPAIDALVGAGDPRVLPTPTDFAIVSFPGASITVSTFDSTGRQTFPLGIWGPTSGVTSNGRVTLVVFGDAPTTAILDASLSRRQVSVHASSFAPAQRQIEPTVTASANGVLATWFEPRGYGGTLMARRFDRNRNPLDAQPIALVTAEYLQGKLIVGFTGQVWLIASGTTIYRITADGVVLPALAMGLDLSDAAFASNGAVTALVFPSFYQTEVVLVRFAPDGTRIDTEPVAIAADNHTNRQPAIASNGHEFLVTWTQYQPFFEGYSSPYTIAGQRLSENGLPVTSEPFIIVATEKDQKQSRVVSNGTDYVVTYLQNEHTDPHGPYYPTGRILAKRVLHDGIASSGEGNFLGEGADPAIASNGARTIVTFTDGKQGTLSWRNLYGVAVDANGAPLDDPRVIVRGDSYSAAHGLAAIGSEIWSVYSRVVTELTGVDRVFLRSVLEEGQRRRPSK